VQVGDIGVRGASDEAVLAAAIGQAPAGRGRIFETDRYGRAAAHVRT
jgi:hypothetical protein